jgi:hypothetical protein
VSKNIALENTNNSCPECGSESLIPFVYGLMSKETSTVRVKQGEYAWGGCKISQATDYCKECKKSFFGNPLKRLDSYGDDEKSSLFRSVVDS